MVRVQGAATATDSDYVRHAIHPKEGEAQVIYIERLESYYAQKPVGGATPRCIGLSGLSCDGRLRILAATTVK